MNRQSFTMIELIFVIVVLGILAAVALPKFHEMGQRAHVANLVAFVGTLNGTTGHELWSASVQDGKDGNISGYESIHPYMSSIPSELDGDDINFSKCGDGKYKTLIVSKKNITGKEYNITCKNGNINTAPYFRLVDEDGNILVSRD